MDNDFRRTPQGHPKSKDRPTRIVTVKPNPHGWFSHHQSGSRLMKSMSTYPDDGHSVDSSISSLRNRAFTMCPKDTAPAKKATTSRQAAVFRRWRHRRQPSGFGTCFHWRGSNGAPPKTHGGHQPPETKKRRGGGGTKLRGGSDRRMGLNWVSGHPNTWEPVNTDLQVLGCTCISTCKGLHYTDRLVAGKSLVLDKTRENRPSAT